MQLTLVVFCETQSQLHSPIVVFSPVTTIMSQRPPPPSPHSLSMVTFYLSQFAFRAERIPGLKSRARALRSRRQL